MQERHGEHVSTSGSKVFRWILFGSVMCSLLYFVNVCLTGNNPEHVHVIENPSTIVKHTLNFFERLDKFNDEIATFRTQVLGNLGTKKWANIDGPLKILRKGIDDKIGDNVKNIHVLFLPWIKHGEQLSSFNDSQNLLVQNYYKWTAAETFCEWIKTPGLTKMKQDIRFNRTCSADIKTMLVPQPLEYTFLQGKPLNTNWPMKEFNFSKSFNTEPPKALFYMHVVENAFITKTGDVISKNTKILPYSCGNDMNEYPPKNVNSAPLINEVFVISQFWGESFFHEMNEDLPRVVPYLKFLKENEDIFVHVKENGGSTRIFLELLGIKKERLISGSVRAHAVYLPQGTPCGLPIPQETQLLSYKLRQALSNQSLTQHKPSTNLVLIQRSGLRHFKETALMKTKMHKVAEDFNLTFELFPDKPVPNLSRTFDMFNKAAIVVGPHGAGLSNVLFSKPGTLVVEGVCNRPHVNVCYLWLVHGLGHRYHGIPSSGGCEGFIDLSPAIMDDTVRKVLTLIL